MPSKRATTAALEAQVTDLRLTTLETAARVCCVQSHRLDERLDRLTQQMALLLPHGPSRQVECAAAKAVNNPGCSERSIPTEGACDGGSASSPSSSSREGVPMCDYCFHFSVDCFACSGCGREWYCSSVCQRLRQRSHAARCVASAQQALARPRSIVPTH